MQDSRESQVHIYNIIGFGEIISLDVSLERLTRSRYILCRKGGIYRALYSYKKHQRRITYTHRQHSAAASIYRLYSREVGISARRVNRILYSRVSSYFLRERERERLLFLLREEYIFRHRDERGRLL